jgi:transcriptional regulator with XRE-family HTH domain
MTTVSKGPNPIDLHVGGRIKLRRLMLRMSQEKLAEGLGITFQQVQKYEKGTNRVGASRLQQIAQLLQVPISYFFTENDAALLSQDHLLAAKDDGLMSFVKSREGVELNMAFSRLRGAKARESFLKLVRALAASPLGQEGVDRD